MSRAGRSPTRRRALSAGSSLIGLVAATILLTSTWFVMRRITGDRREPVAAVFAMVVLAVVLIAFVACLTMPGD
jgi:bacteriorhodopsin